MTNYTILPKQSLFDIALEVYGDVTGVAWLLADNPHVPGATGPIFVGEKLVIRADVINARMVESLSDYAPFQTITDADQPKGIGFWRLENHVVQ